MQQRSKLQKHERYVESLSIDQRASLYKYTAFCSRANQLIWRGKKLVGTDAIYYNEILNIFAKGPHVTEAFQVYRGTSKDCRDYSGFISTSRDKDASKLFMEDACCMYTITVPPGAFTVLPLENISKSPDEYEVLLPPGKFHVTGVNGAEIDCVYIPDFSKPFTVLELPQIEGATITIDQWVDKILIDIPWDAMEFMDWSIHENEEVRENAIIEALSNLDYYNSIPLEAIHRIMYDAKSNLYFGAKFEDYKLAVTKERVVLPDLYGDFLAGLPVVKGSRVLLYHSKEWEDYESVLEKYPLLYLEVEGVALDANGSVALAPGIEFNEYIIENVNTYRMYMQAGNTEKYIDELLNNSRMTTYKFNQLWNNVSITIEIEDFDRSDVSSQKSV